MAKKQLKDINGVPVEEIMSLPTRQVRAAGTLFQAKYAEKEDHVIFYFMDEHGKLTGKVAQSVKKPQPAPEDQPAAEESSAPEQPAPEAPAEPDGGEKKSKASIFSRGRKADSAASETPDEMPSAHPVEDHPEQPQERSGASLFSSVSEDDAPKNKKTAKKERKKREKKEKAAKEPKKSRAIDVTPVRTIHFHVGAFLSGMGLVLIVLLGLMAYSYLRYEGIV